MCALSENVLGLIHVLFVCVGGRIKSFGLFYPFWSLRIQKVEFQDLEAPNCASVLEFRYDLGYCHTSPSKGNKYRAKVSFLSSVGLPKLPFLRI